MSDKKFIITKVGGQQNREGNKSVIQLNIKKKIDSISQTDSQEKSQILINDLIYNNNKLHEGKYILLILFIFILDTNNQITMEKHLEVDVEAKIKKIEIILNKKNRMEDSVKTENKKKIGKIDKEKNLINNEIKWKQKGIERKQAEIKMMQAEIERSQTEIERNQTEIQELTTELAGKDEEKKNIQEGETIQLIEIGNEIENEKNNYRLGLMDDIEIKKTLKGFKKN